MDSAPLQGRAMHILACHGVAVTAHHSRSPRPAPGVGVLWAIHEGPAFCSPLRKAERAPEAGAVAVGWAVARRAYNLPLTVSLDGLGGQKSIHIYQNLSQGYMVTWWVITIQIHKRVQTKFF